MGERVPSLKLTANAPENGWLKKIPIGFRPIFRDELLVFREGPMSSGDFGSKKH